MAGIFLETLPHTEEGSKLQLTPTQEKDCKVVYKLSEEDPDKYVFDGLWNPEKEYTQEHMIVPLQSSYKNVSEEYPAGTEFVNVLGSSRDMDGGHVIMNTTTPASLKAGDDVWMLPICHRHNVARFAGRDWGDGFYMKTGRPIKAVILKGYLKQQTVQNAILQMKRGE